MKNKGFTLIELLVVVAIIGILATVVLASLGAARNRAKDAAVLSSMSSYRTQAELDYPTGNYTGLCVSSGYTDLETYIESQGGAVEECDADNNGYRVIAGLPTSFASTTSQTAFAAGEDGVCVNSLGTSQRVDIATASALAAPACVGGEAEGGDTFGRACYPSDRPSVTGTFTGCANLTTNMWVNQSFCSSLPSAGCE